MRVRVVDGGADPIVRRELSRVARSHVSRLPIETARRIVKLKSNNSTNYFFWPIERGEESEMKVERPLCKSMNGVGCAAFKLFVKNYLVRYCTEKGRVRTARLLLSHALIAR